MNESLIIFASWDGLSEPQVGDFAVVIDYDDESFLGVDPTQDTINALNEHGVHDAFQLEYRKSITEWGASGGSQELLVWVTEGLATNALYDIARSLAFKVVQKVRGAHDGEFIDEAEAERWSRYRLALCYRLDAAELQLREISSSEDGTSASFSTQDGTQYSVEIAPSGTGLRLARLTRRTAQ